MPYYLSLYNLDIKNVTGANKIMTKFSIVIPFYNSESTVDNIIMTLNKQSSSDFEVIMVDDCSSDNTYEKLIRSQKNFKNTIFRNNINYGPGYSRNVGVLNSIGEYIIFLDSDDIIDERTIEILCNTINRQKKPDAIIFDYSRILNHLKIHCNTICSTNEGFISIESAILDSGNEIWGKAYKRNIIEKNSIRIPDMYVKEDFVFNKVALSYCDKIYYLKKYLYTYIDVPSSITHTHQINVVQNNIQAFNITFEKINNKYRNLLLTLSIKECLFNTVQSLVRQNKNSVEIINFINSYEEKNENWYNHINDVKLRKSVKLALFFIKKRNIFIVKLITIIKDTLKRI